MVEGSGHTLAQDKVEREVYKLARYSRVLHEPLVTKLERWMRVARTHSDNSTYRAYTDTRRLVEHTAETRAGHTPRQESGVDAVRH